MVFNMAITLVNRESSELTIHLGKDGEKQTLIFAAGERKDELDDKLAPFIEDNLYVKAGYIEVFGLEKPKKTSVEKK